MSQRTATTSRPEQLVVKTNSMFIKGKRLFNEITATGTDEESTLPNDSLSSFKTRITGYLLNLQAQGNDDEWTIENFRLCTQLPTRRSERQAQS